MRIDIDTGGTFTDVVAYDSESGRLVSHKIASTPDDPTDSIVSGAGEAVERGDAHPRHDCCH